VTFALKGSFLDLYLYLYIDVNPLSAIHSWETKIQKLEYVDDTKE